MMQKSECQLVQNDSVQKDSDKLKAYFTTTILSTISVLLSQSKIWLCCSIFILSKHVRNVCKVVFGNSWTLDMMFLYLLLMLFDY